LQETTRLVALITVALTIAMCLVLPSAVFAQEAPADTSADSWGEKGQPDNFVRSKAPAKDGHAYNWLQMGYGSIVMVCMIGFMVWLIRRTPGKDAPGKDASRKDESSEE
jgi:hypothetical protein